MADEPKAPRKRAAKKAVEGEDKKSSKKLDQFQFHYFKQPQLLKQVKPHLQLKLAKLLKLLRLKVVRVKVKSFVVVAAAVAEEDVELAKKLKQMVKMIHKSLLIKVKQVMA